MQDNDFKLKQARNRSGLTQEQAAEKLGVDIRTYQRWEAGEGITLARMREAASTFGASVRELF